MTKIITFYASMLRLQHARSPALGFDERARILEGLSDTAKEAAMTNSGLSGELLAAEAGRIGVDESELQATLAGALRIKDQVTRLQESSVVEELGDGLLRLRQR